jgi:uncharacterized repeat protein (TIGR01451 family)
MKRWLLALVALSTPAAAAPISVAKSATVIADLLGALNPRIMPGSTIEYTLTVQNPLLNPETIRNVAICDDLPESMIMLTADLSSGSGPVAFSQGLLVGSGLTYSYGGLTATGDGLTFFDAAGAAVTPRAGSDPRIRRVCITPSTGRMTGGGSFILRYRAQVR